MHHPHPTSTGWIDRTTDRPTPLTLVRAVFRHRELVRNLVRRDLKLKYRGSVLGVAWSLLNPLAMVAAYTLATRFVLRDGPANYPFFVLVGVAAWTFFNNSANMATSAMIDSAALIRSVRFPRAILPVATVLFNLSQLLLTLAVFVPVLMVIYDRPPAWPLLGVPLMLALQAAFTIGVALMLSVATVHFRDVRHLTEVSLRLLFWTTPVLYSLDLVARLDASLASLLLWSPLAPFIVGFQQMIYAGQWPDPASWGLASAYAVAAIVAGILLFLRLDDGLGEQV